MDDDGFPPVTEGSLLFKSPVSGKYGLVPLRHTDVQIDYQAKGSGWQMRTAPTPCRTSRIA